VGTSTQVFALAAPVTQRPDRLRPAGVVLHVDDRSVAERQDLRPFVPPPGPFSPREHDGDSPTALLQPVNLQVVIAASVSPLDL
jgi:hypothetical protein